MQVSELRRDRRLRAEIGRSQCEALAVRDRLRHRPRAQAGRRRDLADARRYGPSCSGVVVERAFGCFLPFRIPPESAAPAPAIDEPRTSERSLVSDALEDG